MDGDNQAEPLFQQLPTNCDLSVSGFELHVNPKMVVTANQVARVIGADQKGNPLAPYISVVADERLSNWDWFIESGGVRIGSKGAL